MARTGYNPIKIKEPAACGARLPSRTCFIFHCSRGAAPPLPPNQDSLFLVAESVGYSLASYYTSLGLFIISVPGLWSLIKRSGKSKIVQKTFIGEREGKKEPNLVAGQILSFFTRNNFVVTDRGETIT